MTFLVDENMPRSLAPLLRAAGYAAEDVRDIGLQGQPDPDVIRAAVARDAIIITRDRGFGVARTWPAEFTAGVILVVLPDTTSAAEVNNRLTKLVERRIPESLLGSITIVEPTRALSRRVRRR